ncbi:DUF6455 family protein [Marivita sp.]|uniref:DUF6455 family protein n=1 Tax=Marivita sp. TaxID=2003365 RepID=UPI003F6A8692
MTYHALGDAQLHFWLTRSVAKVMGVSLSEAMSQGQLTAQDYASLVTECRQCALVENCQCWLGQQSSIAKSPPPGCANAQALQDLALSK